MLLFDMNDDKQMWIYGSKTLLRLVAQGLKIKEIVSEKTAPSRSLSLCYYFYHDTYSCLLYLVFDFINRYCTSLFAPNMLACFQLVEEGGALYIVSIIIII